MDIQTIAQKLFTGARASHDWDHTIRVLRLCEHIGSEERADMDVLRVAAVLHDIGRPHQDACLGSLCHAVHGAMLAEPIVAMLVFSPEQKDNILHCIRTHRFRGMHVPETLEAKVLFDADKLDVIGAIGAARTLGYALKAGTPFFTEPSIKFIQTGEEEPGELHSAYHEYLYKLRKISSMLYTNAGRRLAVERQNFLNQYFDELAAEYRGQR